MEEFTIYKGTPEGKDTKIGVDSNYPARIKRQNIQDGQILEVHTCVYEVSEREMELQRLHGVKVDTTPYFKMYLRNKSEDMRSKVSAAHMGKEISQEHRAKISATKKGIPRSEETKAKISDSLKGNTRTLGYKHSEETKANISDSLKIKSKCPYCDMEANAGNMKRHIKAKHE